MQEFIHFHMFANSFFEFTNHMVHDISDKAYIDVSQVSLISKKRKFIKIKSVSSDEIDDLIIYDLYDSFYQLFWPSG